MRLDFAEIVDEDPDKSDDDQNNHVSMRKSEADIVFTSDSEDEHQRVQMAKAFLHKQSDLYSGHYFFLNHETEVLELPVDKVVNHTESDELSVVKIEGPR